jgi:DNA-binding MarR family transcriptional regulator
VDDRRALDEPGSLTEPDESLHWQIGLVHRTLSRLWEQRLQASVGLSFSQARAVLTLKAEGEAKLARLSERLGCDIGAMSRAVSRMESKGLLERARDSFDARCLHLSLTERGRVRAIETCAVLNEIENDALSVLTESERTRFVDCLKRIVG